MRRVSKHFEALTIDNSLWKRFYFNRFILPRINHRRERLATSRRSFLLRACQDEKSGPKILCKDWKSLYKLRHKWSTGSCHYREISIPNHELPQVILRIWGDIAITADRGCGIRAWAIKDSCQSLLATTRFCEEYKSDFEASPSTLAIDSVNSVSSCINFAIGFADGFIRTYLFDASNTKFTNLQSFSAYDGLRITALDFKCPHVLSMGESQVLALYRLRQPSACFDSVESQELLASWRSHTAGEPISLTLRTGLDQAFISIAYIYPTYLHGWSVGLQELRLNMQGVLLRSRTATAQGISNRSSRLSSSQFIRHPEGIRSSSAALTKPLFITYAHPYLLITRGDNTLSVHFIRSDDASISISPEMKLWGHTSTVNGAYLGERGKAVTVAAGRDVRVWELEEAFRLQASKAKTSNAISSIKVQHPVDRHDSGTPNGILTSSLLTKSVPQSQLTGNMNPKAGDISNGDLYRKAAVAFDEERLVVLHDSGSTSQWLSVYDFT